MSYQNINQASFEQLAQNQETIIIDVRTAGEYAHGVIPNAVAGYDFLAGEFSQKAKFLDASKTYLIYCRSGNRSAAACEQLANLGFTKVYNLMGGISAYKGQLV